MIQVLIDETSAKFGNTKFIAIDGHGGSGKSTLAELLAKHFDAEIKQMCKKWYKKERAYIVRDNPEEFADLVLDGTKPFKDRV